jgi:diguanylate cyclase (GGDEF)-like protein
MRLDLARRTGGGVALLVVLAALVPLLVAATVVQHRDSLSEEDKRLSFEAKEHTQSLVQTLERARSLTQILAQNPAFQHVYETPGTLGDKVRSKIPAVREANQALAHLETLFPGQIGEACFIDRGGAESARAVKGAIAPLADLSKDETGANFFRPAFALQPGDVYQSKPYVSPDTNEWVIANAAPIPLVDGVKRAIVHFELTLESIRRSSGGSGDYAVQIVDRKTSRILVDTRYPQRAKAPLAPKGTPHTHPTGFSDPKGPHVHLPRQLAAGHFTEGKYRVAFREVAVSEHNDNRWVVVARSTKPRPTWGSSQSRWQLAILAAVLALFPLALLNWLRAQRNLTAAADTDPLTGLGNRRSLTSTLDRLVPSADRERPLMLALYDLDGFKLYNDTFGHPAGDALLKRLADNLAVGVDGDGAVFRMGGDEFCVVARVGRPSDAIDIAETGAQALREHGEGFAVEASFGTVLLPLDADTHEDALRIADQRMYAQKSFSRLSASRQTTDVLVRVLAERDAELGHHGSSVGELAKQTALRMGVSREQAEEIRRAGVLHDIGKLAIPESILTKPGRLTEAEWAFVVTHTIAGERIIAAAPALAGVAQLVRSSHEAWDGSGYPDGLVGAEAPLGARIVAVCDAFEAMTSERPYRPARTVEEALAELRRCAGTQFDPSVVANFCAIVAAIGERRTSAASATG